MLTTYAPHTQAGFPHARKLNNSSEHGYLSPVKIKSDLVACSTTYKVASAVEVHMKNCNLLCNEVVVRCTQRGCFFANKQKIGASNRQKLKFSTGCTQQNAKCCTIADHFLHGLFDKRQ